MKTLRNAVHIAAALLALGAATFSCSSSSKSTAGPTDGGGGNATDGGTDGGTAAFEAGAPITGLTASTWQWVPVTGSACRDGTETGIGVNLGSNAQKLMIFLEGGGACFNETTCGLMNPNHFDSSNFASMIATGAEGSAGIFNRKDTMNPVADWTYVYVPYCTGDIHAGNNPAGMVQGVSGPQQFVGWVNVGLDLQRIVPTFPGLNQVLLTGISAGGFGAAANYPQVASAFGSVPVVLIDDSGPPMENPYLPTCQQQQVTSLWKLDQTLLKACGSDCTNPASYFLDATKHFGKVYPNSSFGLIESTGDGVITLFYGFGTDDGKNDCMGSLVTGEPAAMFTAGLQDLATQMKPYPNFGSYIFDSTQHTSLITSLDTETTPASGVPGSTPTVQLYSWVGDIIAGKVTSVGLPPVTDGGSPSTAPDAGTADGGQPDAGQAEASTEGGQADGG